MQSVAVTSLSVDGKSSVSMKCSFDNGGDVIKADIPNTGVAIPRAASDLVISCLGANGEIAKATVQSRSGHFEQALLPLGSIGVAIDRISGKGFDYPTEVTLQVGKDLVMAYGDAAHVLESKSLVAQDTDTSSSTTNQQVAAATTTNAAADSISNTKVSSLNEQNGTEVKVNNTPRVTADDGEETTRVAADTVHRFDSGVLRQNKGITRFTLTQPKKQKGSPTSASSTSVTAVALQGQGHL